MINITTSPGIDTATDNMTLIISISTRLAGRSDFASLCIKNGIESNMPAVRVIETVKGMCEDNPVFMMALLGESLYNKILTS